LGCHRRRGARRKSSRPWRLFDVQHGARNPAPSEVVMAQLSQVTSNLRLRRSFGKIKKIIDIPNLIEIQKRSYEEFLQAGVSAD
jgi:ribosomal protein L20A (L18A)